MRGIVILGIIDSSHLWLAITVLLTILLKALLHACFMCDLAGLRRGQGAHRPNIVVIVPPIVLAIAPTRELLGLEQHLPVDFVVHRRMSHRHMWCDRLEECITCLRQIEPRRRHFEAKNCCSTVTMSKAIHPSSWRASAARGLTEPRRTNMLFLYGVR